MRDPRPSRRRSWVSAFLVTSAITTLIFLWASTLLPDSLSVMAMGEGDFGGGEMNHSASNAGLAQKSVSDLVADPNRKPDVSVSLVARAGEVQLASGRKIRGFTLNGKSPGPTIRAKQDDLISVTLENESVTDGATLHWHGVDVPNAVDGVAGVTQDAVALGTSYEYRFVAKDPGTYWYHSHQISHEQVQGGLFGALVISPRDQQKSTDVVALMHTYDGIHTINGHDVMDSVALPPGTLTRARIINTDNGSSTAWVLGTGFQVLAVDGRDLKGPNVVQGKSVSVPAGGRVDLGVRTPEDGRAVAIQLNETTRLVLGPKGSQAPKFSPPTSGSVDFLTYGSPRRGGLATREPTRRFNYAIGRRPGMINGRPGLNWTINGKTYPDVPMFMVREGDVAHMRISNTSGEVHPMHLHGHHALVLSRNGVAASGSPWWVDSLTVANGETYEVAFWADNPGIWMDHCHNLKHAKEGLVAHLAYEGVTTPFTLGGPADNRPE